MYTPSLLGNMQPDWLTSDTGNDWHPFAFLYLEYPDKPSQVRQWEKLSWAIIT